MSYDQTNHLHKDDNDKWTTGGDEDHEVVDIADEENFMFFIDLQRRIESFSKHGKHLIIVKD